MRNAEPLPRAAALQANYRRFQADIGALMAPRRLDPDDLTKDDLLVAVHDWLKVSGTAA